MSRHVPGQTPSRSPATLPNLQTALDALKSAGDDRATRAADAILREGVARAASDVHFEPGPRSLDVRFRVDGVLRHVATLPRDLAPNLIARLKVMADLLTYRLDIPQEGSIRPAGKAENRDFLGEEMRVSTFPTVHGEKAVVRLFGAGSRLVALEDLGLPPGAVSGLTELSRERTGAVFLTGPGGSGKTTTIYACLRRLASDGIGRNIVTIEDPVEVVVPGVTQSQARPGTEFDFARGLRSLLRQDPDVIMVGEIRDRETAAVAIEAALTGHLLFSTLHAGSACGVFSRLLEMGVEPYLLTSSVKGVLNQRLVRRLCDRCRRQTAPDRWVPVGCDACLGSGYLGRFPLAELLRPDTKFRKALLDRADTETLEETAAGTGWGTMWAEAAGAVARGRTTPEEIERVLGRSTKAPGTFFPPAP